MTLEEMFDIWAVDSKIDPSDIGNESLKIPQLHHKWLRMLSEQRVVMKKLEAGLKALKNRKSMFFQYGPDDETRAAGWEMPARGRILKTEVNAYVESDRDVVELGNRLSYQAELVDAITDILKTINNRSFQLKNSIEWLKFTQGS